ncbi:MAG TPA: ATP-binding protein [candidate division Zixibacteria bacterium]|nr:ATP-binding protein [candidate division Zixibacteria bacterium]
MAKNEEVLSTRSDPHLPPVPLSVEATELDFGFLADLALKTVYADTNCTTERASQKLKLPMPLTEQLLQHLYREKFVEIRGLISYGNNRYAMLDRGWQRAQRLLEINGYIGPAPVSLAAYSKMIVEQSASHENIPPRAVQAALSGLVLPDATVQTLGLVVNSRRSLFLTGPSGNGKTTIATALHQAQSGEIWIPYAVEVDGQIIKVFDLHNHVPVDPPEQRYDERWVRIKRPIVVVGGEMTIETMDLIYSETVHFYEAPFQMKANGGTLVIDDFGRQRVEPHDLLNRWIIPLEGRVDYLTLHTGKKIEVPFEQLLIFATNLDPKDLVDDAFLRRMGYRLFINQPNQELYGKIYRNYVEGQGLNYDPAHLEFLFQRYKEENRPLRGCEPRDLIQRCLDICAYENRPREISIDLLALAWSNYFGARPASR